MNTASQSSNLPQIAIPEIAYLPLKQLDVTLLSTVSRQHEGLNHETLCLSNNSVLVDDNSGREAI
ncbi:hypothetical protein EIK77_000315, partial [Talaromyces pinophilus]